MSLRTIGAGVVLACVLAFPLMAQENGRYQLERSEEGFVRLDTATGQMSLCRETRGGLQCEAVEDDVERLRRERNDLRDENDELRDELSSRRDFPNNDLPSEEEMEEVAGWVERMLVIMMRTVRNAEEEMDRDSDD